MAASAAGALAELESLFAAIKETDHTAANLYLPPDVGQRMERLNETRDAMLPGVYAYLDELTDSVAAFQACARG